MKNNGVKPPTREPRNHNSRGRSDFGAFSSQERGKPLTSQSMGPAGNRRYQYIPTYILRGLTELHLEFDLVEGTR